MRWRMIALTLLLAACGGGADEGAVGGGGAETASVDPQSVRPVVSGDGVLSIATAAGGAEIRDIDLDRGELDAPAGFELIGVYELAAAEQEPVGPMTLALDVVTSLTRGGVAVIYIGPDGNTDSLDLRLDDGLVYADVPSSGWISVLSPDGSDPAMSVDFDSPAELVVGESVTAGWSLGEPSASGDSSSPQVTTSTEVVVSAPLAASALPDTSGADAPARVAVECLGPGTGSLAAAGLIRFTTDAAADTDFTAMKFWVPSTDVEVATFILKEVDTTVDCVVADGVPVSFTDERCADWNTGDDRADCVVPQVRFSQLSGAGFGMALGVSEGALNLAGDDTITMNVAAQSGEQWVVLDCRIVAGSGSCGWFNQFFLPSDIAPESSILDEGDQVVISNLPLSIDGGAMVLTVPSMDFLDGQGDVFATLEGFEAPLVDISVFTRAGDRFSSGFIDPAVASEALVNP